MTVVITSCWWRGVRRHLSLVANTQYCAGVLVSRGGWYIRLQSLPAAPPTSPVSWITWGSRVAGDGARLFFVRPVQCNLLTVAESAVMHVISGCLSRSNINVFHVNKKSMHKLVIKSRFRFFLILGKNLDFRFRIRESSITNRMEIVLRRI